MTDYVPDKTTVTLRLGPGFVPGSVTHDIEDGDEMTVLSVYMDPYVAAKGKRAPHEPQFKVVTMTERVASLAGVTPGTVDRWLREQAEIVARNLAAKIAAEVGIPLTVDVNPGGAR